jgi:hypothetical protein
MRAERSRLSFYQFESAKMLPFLSLRLHSTGMMMIMMMMMMIMRMTIMMIQQKPGSSRRIVTAINRRHAISVFLVAESAPK